MNRPYRIDSEAIARRISPSARRSSSGWWPLPGICHDRRDRPHLAVRDNRGRDGSDVVSVKCWAGCDRDSVRRAIEGATGWRIWGQRTPDSPAPPRTGQDSPNTGPRPDRREYAWKLWGASGADRTRTTDHPVRRWVDASGAFTGLLRSPCPPAVRWLPAGLFHDQHEGAGTIVVPFAAPDDWIAAWPRTAGSRPVSSSCIMDSEGVPALDKPATEEGLSKRSYGIRQGAVCVLGDPRPENAVGLILVEGLADALALASRYPETAAAVGGVSGMQADRLLDWLTAWPSVTLYADDDPDGIDGARTAQTTACTPWPGRHRIHPGRRPQRSRRVRCRQPPCRRRPRRRTRVRSGPRGRGSATMGGREDRHDGRRLTR